LLFRSYFGTFQLKGILFLYICLGVIKPLIGFNLTHDALHGSYTKNQKLNRFLGYSFDVNGTSSYIWKITHYALAGYICMQLVGGFMISIVFQLAHIIENVEFPEPNPVGEMENNWAAHEMLTTCNFATHNRWLSYFGGLNFQVEHHLFPYICRVHYPRISKIVKKTAKEFEYPYHEQPTFTKAIISHLRLLNKLGNGND